jgi:hypothetical protein
LTVVVKENITSIFPADSRAVNEDQISGVSVAADSGAAGLVGKKTS